MKKILKNLVVYFLTLEARAVLRRHNPKIVAVTGNVGKTSTKDAIYAVLREAYGQEAVWRSEKSMNSEIGLPLAILGLSNAWSSFFGWLRNIWRGLFVIFSKKDFPEWLVLEVGADHPHDIEKISTWLHADIVVLTRMSDIPVHVEFFKDAEAMLAEKMFLAKALKSGGTLVINIDDKRFEKAVMDMDVKKIFYGASKVSHVEILQSEALYDKGASPLPLGERALIRMGDTRQEVELLGVLGSHLIYPLAAAMSVALVLNIESSIPEAFQKLETPRGRMRILRGINSSAVIDDTYNSSPLASLEALKTVGKLSIKGRKIAVLGDMKELGEMSESAHLEIGRLCLDTVHTLVTVGELGEVIERGAKEAGLTADRMMHFGDSREAAKALRGLVRAGDVVLVKGSQSMRMERISKALLAEPEKASELLVRQEEEWLEKE